MSMKKIVTRIKGGLGNQLFCYAAARRLAIKSNAELVIDDVTGFARDFLYQRKYGLHRFNIQARKATPSERFEPHERVRRSLKKFISRHQSFANRSYIEQEGNDFDHRLINLNVNRTIYLDGYWQSEKYFKSIENIIRQDLQITPPDDELNMNMAYKIAKTISVAIHVRWFDESGGTSNISVDYYHDAISFMERKFNSPHYFLFSNNPNLVRKYLDLPKGRVTFISHNIGDENAYADMWLMGLCQHFITANSTFSWWGAWLGGGANKTVITPALEISGIGSWGFKGLIPDDWIRI